jgi:hypothetical protein
MAEAETCEMIATEATPPNGGIGKGKDIPVKSHGGPGGNYVNQH